jgi:hypothetical protein
MQGKNTEISQGFMKRHRTFEVVTLKADWVYIAELTFDLFIYCSVLLQRNFEAFMIPSTNLICEKRRE